MLRDKFSSLHLLKNDSVSIPDGFPNDSIASQRYATPRDIT